MTTSAQPLVVDHCTSGDFDEIARIMTDTMLLGQPVPGVDIDEYVAACLSCYRMTAHSDAVICRTGDNVAGYALISLDPQAAEGHARRQAMRLAAAIAVQWVTGRLSAPTRRFYKLRTIDTVALMRGTRDRGRVPHAHMNVVSGARSGRVAHALLQEVDRSVRTAGFDTWIGEINAVAGSRQGALERLGFTVLSRSRNHTLSGLSGRRVERLTVERCVPTDLSA
ncbi:MAG: hypothetical protein ACO20G_07935 [Ilumatobacteraceae bacterium]